MATNEGKKFEEDFINSVPQKWFRYRLKDAGGWGKSSSLRFTITNMCDFIVFNGDKLLLLELKSHKGNSFPLSPKMDKKGNVKNYGVVKATQLNGLIGEVDKPNTVPGFIFNLRDKEQTFFVYVKDLYKAIMKENRRSINLKWLQKYGILIEQKKKITRYKYNVQDLIKGIDILVS